MAKKPTHPNIEEAVKGAVPVVAATLTGIIYQAKLFNRQARVNVPEGEVVVEVIGLWRNVMEALNSERVPELKST